MYFNSSEDIMTIKQEILDELLKGYTNPEDLMGKGGIFDELQKRLLETVMKAEMGNHLGYEKNSITGNNTGNSRNGKSKRTVKTKSTELELEVPRDRNSSFESTILPKHQRRFDGFNEQIISLYSRGMTTREIQEHLKEIYQIEVSPTLISDVTSAVIEDAKTWQSRPLERFYPFVFLDALRVKIRDSHSVKNKSIYLAIAINDEGNKEVLGLWIAENEGASFRLSVLTDINNRGVEDILVASVDGLKGFPEAIESVFPKTEIQLCIVHMVRHSLKFVRHTEKKEVAKDLKSIYTSNTLSQAEQLFADFKLKWDEKHPAISKSWEKNWARIIPFFDFPKEIRRVIYTTNSIESLNMTLRKNLKVRSSFPSDEAALKLLYLSLEKVSKKWTMPFRNWGKVLQHLMIKFEDQFPEN